MLWIRNWDEFESFTAFERIVPVAFVVQSVIVVDPVLTAVALETGAIYAPSCHLCEGATRFFAETTLVGVGTYAG